MDWNQIYTLLIVIEKAAAHGPKMSWLAAAAQEELEGMKPEPQESANG